MIVRGGVIYEDDFPAEEQTEIKGSWLSCKNEYSWRKEGIGFQKSKGKSKIIRMMNQGHKKLWPFFTAAKNPEIVNEKISKY